MWGEIITFYDDGSVLPSIDELELYFGDNHEIMYLREKREVFYEDGKKEYVDIYVYKKDIKNEPHIYIATGDWRVFLLNR
ncbi:gamma-glutamylcyclotransferase [Thermoanaerobacter wiegelii]|uniref:gamma-glutamylcyclotransferase n=1 Tax=Thermoanaerobacter wiegelii TaxID=46354 RepID=UPI000A033D2B|nr:gamma-glutamylcyclotransferase [Thermoanaerobacter wiegelii]